MNTTLEKPGTSAARPVPPPIHRPRRVRLVDRAALHLGVALIAWSRRPLAIETGERRVRRREIRYDLMDRNRTNGLYALLTLPPR